MGIKDSKLVNLTHEEALKRVTDAEQKKIREAFKRSSTLNGHMSKAVFMKDVLGDGVPVHIAERLYEKFGGSSKGISSKELTCGLVLLTRGKEEEKLKFLFGFYSNEPYQHIDKTEMDSIILRTEGNVVEQLGELFRESDQVSYETFKSWIKDNVSCLSMSTWLLKESTTLAMFNDQQAPTFYQTLAGITHLEETDIMELEKQYWQLKSISKNGKFDLETFSSIVFPPLSTFLCEGMFRTFDENQDNHIDLKELACGISACCRGPTVDQFKFCFKLFDTKRLGILQRPDILRMMQVMMDVRKMTRSPDQMGTDGLNKKTEEELCLDLLSMCENASVEHATQGEYLIWALKHPLTNIFLSFLIQVCHICLGLRPRNKEEESAIIIPWLAREEREGLKVDQLWYLVSISWWRIWSDYIQMCQDTTQDSSNSSSKHSSASASPAINPTCLENGGISLISYQKIPSTSSSSSSVSYTSPFQNGSPSSESPSSFSLPPSLKGIIPTSIDSNSLYSNYATLPRKSPSNLTTTSMSSSLQGESSSSTPAGSPKASRRVSLIQRPAGVDNSSLVLPPAKVSSLTNEGGILKRDFILKWKKDFEVVSEAIWKVFSLWYGKPLLALPRTVIEPYEGASPTLDLYPIQVKLLRSHNINNIQRVSHPAIYAGMNSGLSGIGMAGSSYLNNTSESAPQRYIAYTATFSCKHTFKYVHDFISGKLKINKEDMRLWKIKDETNSCLLEDEEKTLEHLKIFDNQQILIEVRNKDLTWPEEILKMSKNKALVDKSQTEKGATGLNNLGNTCFMNSALQCLSNTRILTAYFTDGKHLYELNRTNPLGARGHLAEKYGQLVKDLWSGQAKSIVPVKLRWTINKYAPCFNDFQQHDSQELLAFVLDGLHEDLNRVHDKPYVELRDSDGRPDEIVAHEAWENHFVRNQSIMVDLFHGQLKSQVKCLQCNHTSVKFDPFTFLSLPLPLESCIHLEVIVVSMDALCPVKYGLKLNTDDTFSTLKSLLSRLSNIPSEQLLVVEVFGSLVKGFPHDDNKVKLQPGFQLFAYRFPSNFPVNVALQRFAILSSPFPLSSLTTTSRLPPPEMMTSMSSSRNSSSSSLKNNATSSKPTLPPTTCGIVANDSLSSTTTSTIPDSQSTTMVTSEICASNVSTSDETVAGSDSELNYAIPATTTLPQIEAVGCSNSALKGPLNQQDSSFHPSYYHHYQNSNIPAPQQSVCLSKIQRLTAQQVQTSFQTHTANNYIDNNNISSSCRDHNDRDNNTRDNSCFPHREHLLPLCRDEDSSSDENLSVPNFNGFLEFEYFSNPIFVVAVHRKMIPSDYYFLWFQSLRASLFGIPLVLPCHQFNTHQDLYQQVWNLISRLVSPLPPSDATAPNHAQDCDDSLKYEFPFVLKVVQKDGMNCVWCPWYRFCKGCPIECNSQVFNYASCYLAIDWEPTALHLRYHASQEKVFIEHESMETNRKQSIEPIGLDACLKAFTKEEHLGEKELYFCSKCKKHGHAVKKLELWSLPPILIIHLKRFQFFNNRWVKSQKIVKFPMKNFDPSNYLVQRNHPPSSTYTTSFSSVTASTMRSTSLSSSNHFNYSSKNLCNGTISDEGSKMRENDLYHLQNGGHSDKINPDKNANMYIQSPPSSDTSNNSFGDTTTATRNYNNLQQLQPDSQNLNSDSNSEAKKEETVNSFHAQDHSNIKYDLYAVSCHSGILGCGHYTTYAKNPNGKWYYYNDSSCKEVTEEQVDSNSAYMLFYERQGLDTNTFLSSVSTSKECENSESDEEMDKELKRMCILH